jgi:hypothetical protein
MLFKVWLSWKAVDECPLAPGHTQSNVYFSWQVT